jgi:N-acetyl-anhydromuramyl-L-alanine amidase AmpD
VYASKRWKEQLAGAHVAGKNADSIGICLVGNFEETAPTDKEIAALKGLLLALKSKTGLGESDVTGHGALGKTDCPGKYCPYMTMAKAAFIRHVL